MYTKEVDYDKLCRLDVLGIEDGGRDDPLDIHREFVESITQDKEGRYEVMLPFPLNPTA